MSTTDDELFKKMDKYMGLSKEVIAAYKIEVDELKSEIRLHETYEIALKEMMCRIIEGKISEETQQRLLKKFRS